MRQQISFDAPLTGGTLILACAGGQITVGAHEALASRVVDLLSSAGERAVPGGFASDGLTVILPDLTLPVAGHDLTAAVTGSVTVERLRAGVTSGRWYAHARNAPPSLAHDATGEEVAAQILAAYAQAAEGACSVAKDGGVYEVEFASPGPRGLLDAQSIDLARAVTVTVS